MRKQARKLRISRETLASLALWRNEQLKEVGGGTSGVDTCAGGCTDYNCGYSYRNCYSSPQNPCGSV